MENMNNNSKKNEEVRSELLRKLNDRLERARRLRKGTLTLATPIRAGDKDIEKLNFDFNQLDGLEMVECMDQDLNARDMFKITRKQALHLFALVAEKATPGIDKIDILERMSAEDAITAVEMASTFFIASSRGGDMRITTE